jgi:outer membrane protein assembly factor BamE
MLVMGEAVCMEWNGGIAAVFAAAHGAQAVRQAGPRGYNEAIISPARCLLHAPVARGGNACLTWVAFMHQSMSRLSSCLSAGPRRVGRALSALAVAGVLSACSGWSDKLPDVSNLGGLVTPYKIDIVQGNVVTREQAQALQVGMSRQQVRELLGSPLLASVFHADRWDYVFTFRRQGQATQQRKLTVHFKAEALERFEADELPSEEEFVSSLDVKRKSGKAPALQATDEQLKTFQERNAAPVGTPTPVPAALPASTSYPPLETPGTVR